LDGGAPGGPGDAVADTLLVEANAPNSAGGASGGGNVEDASQSLGGAGGNGGSGNEGGIEDLVDGSVGDEEEYGSNPPAETPMYAPPQPEPGETNTLSLVFYTMGESGPTGMAKYEETLADFAADPEAVFLLHQAFYATQEYSVGDVGLRGTLSFLASQLRRPDACDFLRELALTPPAIIVLDDGERRDLSYDIRYNAGVGLSQSFKSQVPWGFHNAIPMILEQGEADIAEQLALELFAMHLLPEGWHDMVRARGIQAEFRKLSEAEVKAIYSAFVASDDGSGMDSGPADTFE